MANGVDIGVTVISRSPIENTVVTEKHARVRRTILITKTNSTVLRIIILAGMIRSDNNENGHFGVGAVFLANGVIHNFRSPSTPPLFVSLRAKRNMFASNRRHTNALSNLIP